MKAFAARVARGAPNKPKKPVSPGHVSKFVQGFILAFIVMVLVGAAAYKILRLGPGIPEGDPAELAEQAREALDAVKKRDLSKTMNPASYDDILIPIDQMLREAKAKLEGDSYNPISDFEYILARCAPIPEIADEAHRQALSEKTFLKKEYRFMEQKGDACHYWSSALWNRLEADHARRGDGSAFVPTPEEADQLLAIIGNGLDAAPEDPFLWYTKALVERAGGGFGAAEESLARALELDPNFIAAWNDLGLVRINLKQFDKAGEAMVKAKDLAAAADTEAGGKVSDAYVTALMNLADFHDALASFYERENRIAPSEENGRELNRHTAARDKYAAEVRGYTEYTPPSEQIAGF